MNSKLVHNELVKLRATFFNNIAVGAITVGGTIPLINHDVNYPTSLLAGCLLAGVLHACGSIILLWLKE
jgi:hypothetical protein